MPPIGLRLTAGLLTSALLLAPAAAAQQPQQKSSQGQEQTIRVQVELVNVFASVRGKNRGWISDLKKEEFRIFEDGKEQKIEFFRAETAKPITVGIVLDTSGSMERIFRAEQDTASRFLRRVIQEKDLAMVMSFDIDVNLLADFTNDHSRLENAIRRAHINAPRRYVTPGTVPDPGGGTNLYDALYLGCTEQLARETGRKALVVLTDAWDTGSRMNLEEALEACQRTDTVLHFIVIAENYGFGYSTAREGVARKLAEETGGRAISVDSEKDLEKAFDVLVEELRSQYTLGFYPTNPNRDGKFRRLKVETTRKDTKVLSRKGYYPPKS